MAENNDMTPPEGEQPERDDAFNEMLSRAEQDAETEEGEEESQEDSATPAVGSAVSEEQLAQSMLVDMPTAHGEIIEGANGGEGTIVRSAYLGKEMQASFLEYSMSVIVSRALPEPAGQRLEWHCGWHGDEHPAAQPRRDNRRDLHDARQPRSHD